MIRRNHASMLGLRIYSHRYNVYGIKQVINLSLITCLIQLSQAINSPSVPTAVGKCKISMFYIVVLLFSGLVILLNV